MSELRTNLPGPYKISLSRTYPYSGGTVNKERNAIVKIIDETGHEEYFTESEVGVYTNINESLRGTEGKSYKLYVKTSDGQEYESDFQTLIKPVSIDSINFEYLPDQFTGLKGLQIYIYANDPSNEVQYYAWDYTEAWKFEVPYGIDKKPGVRYCFKYDRCNELLIYTTKDKQSSIIQKHPLYYIAYDTDRLRIRYSALVRQYSIDEATYMYLKEVKRINENSGSLYSASPTQLQGNVRNIDNPDIPVVGLFQVSGVAGKRFFIDSKQIPASTAVHYNFDYCETVMVPLNDTALAQEYLRQDWVIMDSVLTKPEYINFANYSSCYDCTLSGTLAEPDFWY